MLLPNVSVDEVVELAKPHGQVLSRVHSHGPELRIAKLLLEMTSAELTRVVLSECRYKVAHCLLVLFGRVVGVWTGMARGGNEVSSVRARRRKSKNAHKEAEDICK